jgi:diguanylate cyclase (GGDEF)-like protein/PAS domain S-box-containing protein
LVDLDYEHEALGDFMSYFSSYPNPGSGYFNSLSPYILRFERSISSIAKNIRNFFPSLTRLNNLAEEVNLLAAYSSDTVYRLRYEDMVYDYVSPAIIKLLGFTPEEMKKINFRSLISETRMVSDGMKIVTSFDELEKLRKSGNVNKWHADYLIRAKDGKHIWVTDISFPWLDDKGKVIGSVGSLRDITDRINAENIAKNEMLKLANTDALTGIHNRHSFFAIMDNELKRFKRSKRHFAILLIDIDHFKKINDIFGYESGDKILVELSQKIKNCLRDTDIVARLDGEEFGVFLPDTTEEGAAWVAKRICKDVAQNSFFVGGAAMGICHISVSIGVASTEDKMLPNGEEIYKQADARLYIAKQTGRNQVSVDEVMHVY